MDYRGEEFLERIYKDIYLEDKVVKSSSLSDGKYEKIRKYLERLERVHDKVTKKDKLSLLKRFYYDKYVIKEENITDDYFNHLENIALERGFGHVNYSEEEKMLEKEKIIKEQKTSLDNWIDYFVSDDSKQYPIWFKYYVFNSVVKLGSYDKEKDRYNKRTDKTISNFPDLNREAVSLSYDFINKYLDKETINDEVLERLIKNGSFKNIYAYIIKKLDSVNKDKYDSSNGIWVKYDQGSDHMKLVNTLVGKGTGWCTAGEETAKNQLANGDFYVYYTIDSNGEYTNPRIAIRMENNNIAEIRGIAKNQNIESDMESVVEEKLKEFPDRDRYKKKVQDMELLTKIYKEYKTRELTKDELRFLYEMDEEIEGFGYQKDPRIEEILKSRDKKIDLSYVLDCKKEEIATSLREALNENIKYYQGDINLSGAKNIQRILIRTMNIDKLLLSKKLVFPECVNGDIWLGELESAKEIVFPKKINGNLFLNSITSAEGVKLPEEVKTLGLYSLTSIKGLVLPKKIDYLNLGRITNADGLELPSEVNSINMCCLQSANGIKFPKRLYYLDLSGLESAEGLVLPNEVEILNLKYLHKASGIRFPEKVSELDLSSLESAEGVDLPKEIKTLRLDYLKSAEGLVLPNVIDFLGLYGLRSAKGLDLSKSKIGYLNLGQLVNSEGLILPNELRSLRISGLKTAKGLVLPSIIRENLDLFGLISAEGIKFPNIVGGIVDLSSLETIEGLELPPSIELNNVKMPNELKKEYKEKKEGIKLK